MKRLFGCCFLALAAAASVSDAQAYCTSYPDPLTNGTTADASQVTSDFTYLAGCLAPVASPSFTGNVGIGVSSPVAQLEIGGNQSSTSWTTAGLSLDVAGSTLTDTSGSGTIGTRVSDSLGTPTFAASNTETITNAATLYIPGAPAAGANVTITNPISLWVAGGIARLDGFTGFGQVTPTSVVQIGGNHSAASWTTQGLDFYIGTNTLTDTTGSGTIASRVASSISTPTFAASSAETITNAATFFISGPPTAGTNVTITNGNSLWVNGGDVRLDGLTGFGGVVPVSTVEIGGSQSSASWTTGGRAFYVVGSTMTDTSGSGTIGTRVADTFGAPTFAASNTETITNAVTLYVAGAPSAGTDVTITNPIALDVAAGVSYFGGNVGIGTTTPAYLLQIGSSSSSGIVLELKNSSGTCTHNPGSSSETVSCSSDARLKKDIVDAKPALPALDDMRVRDFTIRATGERRTGVIAQEMLKNHSDMVHMGPDGFYKVDEPDPWKLVKAIQELKAANDAQAAQIAQLETQVSALERKTGTRAAMNGALLQRAAFRQ
jgi:hypothetical protein